MALEFDTSGEKLELTKVWGLISIFVEVTDEKLEGDLFALSPLPHPQ